MEGRLLIFSAPSGAGKTSIVKALLQQMPQLEFSVSATSRPMRKGETNGKDYYFLSKEAFKKKIENNEFLEWEEVYSGSFYGTLRSEIIRIWDKGNHVVFDVDAAGGINIKKQYGSKALSVFVMPPSIEELEKRLINRKTESPESLKKRLDKARYELGFANDFDNIVVNDNLQQAIDQSAALVNNFLKQG